MLADYDIDAANLLDRRELNCLNTNTPVINESFAKGEISVALKNVLFFWFTELT